MLNNFYLYWTEINDGGKKMRFEMKKVFQLSSRLVTWYNNNYEKQKTSTEQKLHQDGTILHQGQMNVTEGGW